MSIDATRRANIGSPSLWERTWDRVDVFFSSLLVPNDEPATTTRTSSSSDKKEPKETTDWVALGVELTLRLAIAVTSSYLLTILTRRFLSALGAPDADDAAPSQRAVQDRLTRILRKRQHNRKRINSAEDDDDDAEEDMGVKATMEPLPPLDSYERQMANEILDPDEITTTFHDIGGLDDTKREIYQLAVLPLVEPDLFNTGSQLIQPCKGILLFGKPGTGKTMLAKALAAEAQAVFIPLQLSRILNKWVGESNKLIAATFRLATKLQPSIIFIDELDTFLKSSSASDNAPYLDSIKAEFLTLWDGVGTAANAQVLVLGATNKPHAIDPAILRRMPRAFAVPLPNAQGRLDILKLLLEGENVEPAILTDFLPQLASNRMTAGYSGSDLKELAKAAAMVRVQERTAEYARRQVMGETTRTTTTTTNKSGSSSSVNNKKKKSTKISKQPLRPISKQDLLLALQKVRRSGAAAKEYGREELMESLVELAETERLKEERFSSVKREEEEDDAIPDM